ncbi:SOS response-associated peptidase family protein [Vibrio sp. CyArs1]|uniref:SOS response-associated peptidase n=1 Tax=Vibrio sp. CyArs1 TaxID=2682577 RepID=UPI001F06BF48|nr:SOS response-associated peptidase family protein [Vibrio sp. CyArs1]
MCGRLNIIDDPFSQLVSRQLGITFYAKPNQDIRPSEQIQCIVASPEQDLFQFPLGWGLRTSWSSKLIINAQAETVSIKPTFQQAFALHRVVIPCSGWYEWSQGTSCAENKTKCSFYAADNSPLYMAAIGYPESKRVITLTTAPTQKYLRYHHRMPALLAADSVSDWLNCNAREAEALLKNGLIRNAWTCRPA